MTAARKIIAVIDDDESLRRALGRLLRAAGFDPLGYASAEEFLDDPAKARADCLVLDVHLGGMSGFDLERQLVAGGAAPPIVFLTAYEDPKTSEQARKTGCIALLYKPVPGALLLEAVRRAVGTGTTVAG
jgi:FixJ family two-component response regulator